MNDIYKYITEKLRLNKDIKPEKRTKLDDEMEMWDNRMKDPYGQALKELQTIVMNYEIFDTQKNEYGLNIYTPFDNYVTAYALDGNKQYTYKHIKQVCDSWDWTKNYRKIKKQLEKIKKLADENN